MIEQPFYITTKGGITPDYVRSTIRKVKRTQPVDFVIVDYIQRMKGTKRGERSGELEECATTLADIAREENVIMLVLSQISNEYEKDVKVKKDKASIINYAKGSGAIIEACDVAIGIDTPGHEEVDPLSVEYVPIDAEILQRDGISGVRIPLKAVLKYAKFESDSQRGSV
jgi:replicative DNA helicase